jgi:ABC-2 type transport system permease protein
VRAWWQGSGLVAGRALRENLRSRTFKIVSVLLLVISIAGVTVPQLLRDDETTYTLVTIGRAPAAVVDALDAAGRSGDFEVVFALRPDEEAVRQVIRDGDADAGLVGDTLYTSTERGGTFPAVVSQTVVTLEVARRLDEAGLTPEQIEQVRSAEPPEQVAIGRVEDESRAGIGFAVGVVLYMALTFAGSAIATTIGMEKSTRISEVLLAVVRPSQVLVGNVLAVGLVTLFQLVVLATPLAVAVQVTDNIGLPPIAGADLALAIVWFLLGFALYAFVFAAAAALVNKITEVTSAITPVSTTLLVAYLLGVLVVTSEPGSVWSVVLSLFPLTAPLAMPVRWASGEVPVWELVLAMVLTAATAVLCVRIASSIYGRALLVTGHRVRLRELLGGRASAKPTSAR